MNPLDAILEDWEISRNRLVYWWENELYDRALVCVTAPRQGVQPAVWPGGPVTPEIQWTDIDYMIWRMLENIRTTYSGGEALPLFYHGWSVGHALVMGCVPQFASDTVWTSPLPVTDGGYPSIQFLRDSRWWQWMLECTRQAAQASQGRYFVMPTWGNHAGDNLALLRGTQQLMFDICQDPEWVRQAVQQVSTILLEIFNTLWSLVDETVTGLPGSVNYCGLWSPGKTMGFDCDISCCLSPRQLEEFFLPPLIETMRTVDHCIYHLDGTVALQHLDLLLAVPEIDAIQWVPGAGREAILQWVPLIRRVQQSGKSILVQVEPADVPSLLEEVPARGLCISTSCPSDQEAQELLEYIGRRSDD
jgi:hypothetical protein